MKNVLTGVFVNNSTCICSGAKFLQCVFYLIVLCRRSNGQATDSYNGGGVTVPHDSKSDHITVGKSDLSRSYFQMVNSIAAGFFNY